MFAKIWSRQARQGEMRFVPGRAHGGRYCRGSMVEDGHDGAAAIEQPADAGEQFRMNGRAGLNLLERLFLPAA
jgi:hypothetical protein